MAEVIKLTQKIDKGNTITDDLLIKYAEKLIGPVSNITLKNSINGTGELRLGPGGLQSIITFPNTIGTVAYEDWVSDRYLPLSGGRIDGDLTVSGDVNIHGSINTIESQIVKIKDKQIELGHLESGSPTDGTADNGGLILKGNIDKTILWNNSPMSKAWEFNQGIKITASQKNPGVLYIGTDDPTNRDNRLNYDGEFHGSKLYSEGFPVVTEETFKGAVTSIDMSVPQGLQVSGGPITTEGVLEVTYQQGYSIPQNSRQANWDRAYSWGDHAGYGYVQETEVSVLAEANKIVRRDENANISTNNEFIGTNFSMRYNNEDESIDFIFK